MPVTFMNILVIIFQIQYKQCNCLNKAIIGTTQYHVFGNIVNKNVRLINKSNGWAKAIM